MEGNRKAPHGFGSGKHHTKITAAQGQLVVEHATRADKKMTKQKKDNIHPVRECGANGSTGNHAIHGAAAILRIDRHFRNEDGSHGGNESVSNSLVESRPLLLAFID